MTALSTIPQVARGQREHAVALAAPMVGCPWVGDPRVEMPPVAAGEEPKLPAWFDWEVGRYAAALLRKREPAFAAGDLSHLRTRFVPPATVIFVTDVRCRRSRRRPDGLRTLAVAEIALPDHVFGPPRRALPPPTATEPLPPRAVPPPLAPFSLPQGKP